MLAVQSRAREAELADRIADDMDDFIWRMREDFAVGGYPEPDEAARTVSQAIAAGRTPVAVGDHSDRPGDATHILKAFEAAEGVLPPGESRRLEIDHEEAVTTRATADAQAGANGDGGSAQAARESAWARHKAARLAERRNPT